MASPSTQHSDEYDDMEAETAHVASSLAAGMKWKSAKKGEKSKVSQRSSKKKKFQSLIEQSEQFPIFKLLRPRYINLDDQHLCSTFPQLVKILQFQGWINFVSQYRVYYP